MKLFKNLLILLMVIASISTLCACDFIDNIINGIIKDGNDYTSQTYTEQQPADDTALLEAHGYKCNVQYVGELNFEVNEEAAHAESGTLKAVLLAHDSDGGTDLIIYYLATTNDAKNCYNKMSAKSVYKVKGNKLIYNDNTGLFN